MPHFFDILIKYANLFTIGDNSEIDITQTEEFRAKVTEAQEQIKRIIVTSYDEQLHKHKEEQEQRLKDENAAEMQRLQQQA